MRPSSLLRLTSDFTDTPPPAADVGEFVHSRFGAWLCGYLACRGQQLGCECIGFMFCLHLTWGHLMVRQDVAEFVGGCEPVTVDVVGTVRGEDHDGPGQA